MTPEQLARMDAVRQKRWVANEAPKIMQHLSPGNIVKVRQLIE